MTWDALFAPLDLYFERTTTAFWAEPFNALSNLSFVLAGIFACVVARRERVTSREIQALISLAILIGIGSFVFHTVPNKLTMWLDLLPIFAFQCYFLWLYVRRVMHWRTDAALACVALFFGTNVAAVELGRPYWNGSASYLPAMLMLLLVALHHARTARRGRWLLLAGVGLFVLSIVLRSVDMQGWLPMGTHFLWHTFNGVLIYLTLLAMIERYQPNVATR